jgi:microcystin-dependent protein
MADVLVNHDFVSAKSDGPDTTFVRPSNWNAPLKFTGGADGDALIRDTGTPTGASWQPGVPVGSVSAYAGATAPSGWLLCDGAAVSRTTFAALFGVVGTTYGPGDGSTTFNVPNLKGRVPVGFDSGQTEFDALAEAGGEKVHTLSTAEMPSHTHGLTDPTHAHTSLSHSHAADVSAEQSFGTPVTAAGSTSSNSFVSTTAAGTGLSVQSAGSGSAHNNLQPYLTLNYIIRT